MCSTITSKLLYQIGWAFSRFVDLKTPLIAVLSWFLKSAVSKSYCCSNLKKKSKLWAVLVDPNFGTTKHAIYPKSLSVLESSVDGESPHMYLYVVLRTSGDEV